MQEQPHHNEQMDYHRPPLDIDLSGPDGNVFYVLAAARQHLTGHALEQFNRDIGNLTLLSSGATYQDILQTVDTYLDLMDTSGLYPQYGPQAHIMAAVDRLNAHLQLLPPGVTCEVTGLYPELDNPDTGADKYGQLLEEELWRVEGEVQKAGEDTVQAWLQLRSELSACLATLRRAGVER